MPRGREHTPPRAVRTSRDGVVAVDPTPAPKGPGGTPGVETDPAALRHAALCRLVAQGFDRLEAVTADQVAMHALVAAAYVLPPDSRASTIAVKAWSIAEAWLEERTRFHARQADAAKRKDVAR